MCETMLQITVTDLRWKIPDNNSVILLHQTVNLLLAHINMDFTTDLIFVFTGVHLVYQISRISVSVNYQKPTCLIKSGVNISGSPNPDQNDHKLYQCHLHHRPRIQKPAVNQCDLEIRKNIRTDRCDRHRIKYIDPLQITNLQSSIQSGKQDIDQCIDCDQHPVTLPPERLKDQASVKIVPDIRKNSCLGNHHKACQTENNKAFKIFSSFHQNTSYSTINYDIYYFFFLTLLL